MKNFRTITAISCVIMLLAVFAGINAVSGDPVRGYCQHNGQPQPYTIDCDIYQEKGVVYKDDSIIADDESNYDVGLVTDMNQLKKKGIYSWFTYEDGVKIWVSNAPFEDYGRKVCQMVTCR